jgi:hypothetical protein
MANPIKGAIMRRVLLIVLATFVGCGSALAGTLVEFPNTPGREPKQLIGYLAQPGSGLSTLIGTRPAGAVPYPAVIVLHGCGGIFSHSVAIADRLGGWGYVALTIDTLGPRGVDSGLTGAQGIRNPQCLPTLYRIVTRPPVERLFRGLPPRGTALARSKTALSGFRDSCDAPPQRRATERDAARTAT